MDGVTERPTVMQRLVRALLKSILFFAIAHIVILLILVVRNGDIYVLNVFSILNIDILLSGIDFGAVLWHIVSLGIMLIVFIVMYRLS